MLPDAPLLPNQPLVTAITAKEKVTALPPLPPPPLPADCDLSDFRFMPLDIGRLLSSPIWIEAGDKPKIAHAMLSLWCEAWRQVPAASLPNNDKMLMRLAQCDSDQWQHIRPLAMDGFVLCADNRWYHPHLTDKAQAAWERRLEYRSRMQRVRTSRKQQQSFEEVSGEEETTSLTPHSQTLPTNDDFNASNPGDSPSPSLHEERHHSVHSSVHNPVHNAVYKAVDRNVHSSVRTLPLSREEREKERKRKREGEDKFQRRGSRLPASWILPDEWRLAAEETCTQFQLPPCNLDLEAIKFRDFWRSKAGAGAIKLDWRATWLNWIRRIDKPASLSSPTGFDPVAYLAKQQADKGEA